MKPIENERRCFATGNEVVAWAALAADAEIMYGYPITPQNEVMHYWTRLAPKFGRKFLQTEDELSAGFTTVGGVVSGHRSFTATSGPGNILMQESLVMCEMMRIPMVVVVQQRGGPSTGTVIYSQQEVTMCCYGGNGEGFRVVYSTCSHQELFDYTIKSFNTAWKYRFPTIVLGDGYQAKMREAVTLYDPATRGITMEECEASLGKEGLPGRDRDPVHLINTYNTEEELMSVVNNIQDDYIKIIDEVVEYECEDANDADVLVLSHGMASRAVKEAVKSLRDEGIKAGYFRPITLRPFPDNALKLALKNAKRILVVESSVGQFKKLVVDSIYGIDIPMETYYKPGKGFSADDVTNKVKDIVNSL